MSTPVSATSTGLGIEGVDVAYDGHLAVREVSLDLADGQVLAVLGPSGSGKSTLLRAVAGLEPVAAGRISWAGRDLAGTPTHKRGFALMFQDGQLFTHLTVASTVLSGTLTFEANGSGSLNATNPGNYIYFNLPGGGADVHDGGGPIVTNLRWSLAGSRLTVLQMTCDVVSSGQLIVCSKRDSLEEGHTRIVLLSRSN